MYEYREAQESLEILEKQHMAMTIAPVATLNYNLQVEVK
jgi:hypothetical protein